METRKRSLAKTATWRVIGIAVTLLISYIWLREWGISIALALTANGIKAGLYYMHERVWDRSDFGRRKVREDYTI